MQLCAFVVVWQVRCIYLLCVCCDNSGVICSAQRFGWLQWRPITYVIITEDTEQDLFGVRDDLGPEDTDVSYFDTLYDYPLD